ncbi:MAG: hypothetical protein QG650_357 [Patescibacteria group bacterium]|nr:hypothetical protein [Patescibacteria group bacterium]
MNVAGEAVAITAFEAVNGDESVVLGAVRHWKGKGVDFGKLPAEKQAELIASFATQVAIGVVGSKGIGSVSKMGVAAKTVDVTAKSAAAGTEISASAANSAQALRAAGKTTAAKMVETAGNAAGSAVSATGVAAEKSVSAGAKIGAMATGLDSKSVTGERARNRAKARANATNDERFAPANSREGSAETVSASRFTEAVSLAKDPKALAEALRNLPKTVMATEVAAPMRAALTRMATSPDTQADWLMAIETYALNFTEGAKDAALMAIEFTDPKLWKSSSIFHADLGFSPTGGEFHPAMARLVQTHPDRVAEIASGSVTDGTPQLIGLKRAAMLVQSTERAAA